MLQNRNIKILIFPLILFLIVLIFTIFKIHGSSVGLYYQIFNGVKFKDPNLIAGTLRPIRSDEWAIQTPFAISQSLNNFNSENKFINNQKVYFFTDIPNRDFSSIFKPYNFSYFILPIEFAFSFKWFFRGFLLILASYLLLQKIYKDYFLSITGSLIIFFSPFIQWWYSVSVVESITYGFFCLYFLLKILEYKTVKSLIVNSIFLFYFSGCFLFILYPPFQISVALFLAFLTLGLLWNKLSDIRKKIKPLAISLGIAGISLILICSLFVLSNRETLGLIRNTDYPGQRQINSEGIYLYDFFLGFFNYKLLDAGDGNWRVINASEHASFILLFPFLVLFIFLAKTRKDTVLNSLIIFLLIISTWILFRASVIVSFFSNLGFGAIGWFLKGVIDFVYSLFLLNFVPQKRLILGVGLANLFLIFHFLYRNNENIKFNLTAILIAILGFFTFIYTGYFASLFIPRLSIGNVELICGALLIYFLLLLLFFKFKKTFLISLLAVLIFSSATVNPLYKGLDVITDSKLSLALKSYRLNEPDKKFINYNNWLLTNYLSANGISVLFGTHFYPQFELWQEFDPEGKYKKIYNRYAHIEVLEPNKNAQIIFLPQVDLIRVRIDPCDARLKNLNVGFAVFERPVFYPCLELDKKVNFYEKSVYIYEINQQ